MLLTVTGQPLRREDVRDDLGPVLRWASLPGRFTPRCLRRTFAVELIHRNAPRPYVEAQLWHASIQVTCDVYGRWLPTGNRSLIDRLDAEQRLQQAAERRVGAGGVVTKMRPFRRSPKYRRRK